MSLTQAVRQQQPGRSKEEGSLPSGRGKCPGEHHRGDDEKNQGSQPGRDATIEGKRTVGSEVRGNSCGH